MSRGRPGPVARALARLAAAVVAAQRRVLARLEALPGWDVACRLAGVVVWPVHALAAWTYRRFPRLRRFEWLLEIESLKNRHPVMLAVLLLFVVLRGLRTTPLGHIATDGAIYPLLGAISYFNPFLGLCSAGAFGLGDLVQKLFTNDIFGSRGQGMLAFREAWADPNYWGGIAGYFVSYSSLAAGGLLPGFLARIFRRAMRGTLAAVFFRRHAAAADGANPAGFAARDVLQRAVQRARRVAGVDLDRLGSESVARAAHVLREEATRGLAGTEAALRTVGRPIPALHEIEASALRGTAESLEAIHSSTLDGFRGAVVELREEALAGVAQGAERFGGALLEGREETLGSASFTGSVLEGREETIGGGGFGGAVLEGREESMAGASAASFRGEVLEGVEHTVAGVTRGALAPARAGLAELEAETLRHATAAMRSRTPAAVHELSGSIARLGALPEDVAAQQELVRREAAAVAQRLRASGNEAALAVQREAQRRAQAAADALRRQIANAPPLEVPPGAPRASSAAPPGRSVGGGIPPVFPGAPAATAATAATAGAGATPGGPSYPMAELLASLLGGGIGGWAVMEHIAPYAEMPAFYLRPEPDVSCYKAEVASYLRGRSTTSGPIGPILGGPVVTAVLPPGGDAGASPSATDTGAAATDPDLDPDHERSQHRWWRTSLDDERQRLESYLRHRQGEPDFDQRVSDMQRSIDHYRQKLGEQTTRMSRLGIAPLAVGAEVAGATVAAWDPFKVSAVERDQRAELQRRRDWKDSSERFDKMRAGTEMRGHDQYADPARWDRAMDHVFKDDGTIDYGALSRSRSLFRHAIQTDVDQFAPEHDHWVTDAAIKTVKDAKGNLVVRMGTNILTGGSAEIVFSSLDQVDRMHTWVQKHDTGNSLDAFKWGVQELAKDKLAVRELTTLVTGEVTGPDGTKRPAGNWDYLMSAVSTGLKGNALRTTAQGDFWKPRAYGVDVGDVAESTVDALGDLGDRLAGAGETGDVGEALADLSGSDAGDAGDSGGGAPLADGGGGDDGGGGGGGDGAPPSDFENELAAMRNAVSEGDQEAADRFATRALVRDYDEFKTRVATGEIDSETAQRAVATHQDIISSGVKEGIDRTQRMGDLLGEQTDASGQTTAPIKNVWSPGSGMETPDPANPQVPGDADLTPMVDRTVCAERGLDPSDVQRMAAGHTNEAINEIARQRLGDDLGSYTDSTKIKVFEPGTAEEYLSPAHHDTLRGTVIGTDGEIQPGKTSLGQEMEWETTNGSKELYNEIRESPTGRAMTAADESLQTRKILNEMQALEAKGELSEAQQLEFGRELSKHHGRLERQLGFGPQDIDTQAAGLNPRFGHTVASGRYSPTALQEAIDQNYKGDHSAFYEDVRRSTDHTLQGQLDQGGKIYGAQAFELRQSAPTADHPWTLRVDDSSVVQHTPLQPGETNLEHMRTTYGLGS